MKHYSNCFLYNRQVYNKNLLDNFGEVTFLAVFYRHKDSFSEIMLDFPCEYHFLVWRGQRGSKEGQNLLFPIFKWQIIAENFHRYIILHQKFDCDIFLSNHFSLFLIWFGATWGSYRSDQKTHLSKKYSPPPPLEAANLYREIISHGKLDTVTH